MNETAETRTMTGTSGVGLRWGRGEAQGERVFVMQRGYRDFGVYIERPGGDFLLRGAFVSSVAAFAYADGYIQGCRDTEGA